jgi:serine/threonine protein kinase
LSPTIIQQSESILGYILKERIGDGGYGEVWTAEAPGGIAKAIKFIYGFHDEMRAQRELKSLNHIKQLRHPFLLSLERIDIVDGRLVIVTELADKCLADRYDECIDEGLGGIPRKELVGYMREAADALDYIGRTHSLQHLDIKPENVLLLSGHVKVADFGLVKDIQDCTQSVMGGLTPAYAAPELFDGRPTKVSDQYSLAIVYQEMLTGERPFSGTTPAQLAAQHIHGRPNLRPLPRADQAAVAKALAKDTAHRYPSCEAFVEEIVNGGSGTTIARPPRNARRQEKKNTNEQTVVANDLPTSRSSETVTKLSPVDFSASDPRVHPTLFVGVGGMGTRVLRDLKERFHGRIASTDALPGFRFLAIDVDQDDLYAASRGQSTCGLSGIETFDMPLRRPNEYRKDESLDLSWISRRWIYNIPRSRKTEGIRPLGRLALVDNSERFQNQLAQIVAPFRDEANVRLTAERLGLSADTKPRVYIVGAVSGGVGSGTIIDIAYSVRASFIEAGHDEVEIIGILSHGAGRTSSVRSLSAANTYAFLRELHHIRKNGYPGDDASSIPAFDANEPPFDATYLVHMGEDQTEESFRRKTESLAEYIYVDSATACGAVNKIARGSQREEHDRLRTFGMSPIDMALESSADKLKHLLTSHLFKRWNSESDIAFDHEAPVRKLRANLQLSPSNIFEVVTSTIAEITGLNPFDLATEVARNVGRKKLTEQNCAAVPQEIESSIRGSFHTERAGVNGRTVNDRACRNLSRLAENKVKTLDALVSSLANEPGFRIAKAMRTVDEFETTLQRIAEVMSKSHTENAQELHENYEAWSDVQVLGNKSLQERIDRFANVMARDELGNLAMQFIQFMTDETQGIRNKVTRIAATLKSMATSLPKEKPAANEDSDDGFADGFEHYFVGEVAALVPQLVEQLDDQLQQEYFERVGEFWNVLAVENNRATCGLADSIGIFARQIVRGELGRIDMDDVIRANRIDDDELIDWVRPSVEDATPYILDCGGEARLIVNVPQHSSGALCSSALEVIFDESPTVVPATRGSVTICFEVQQIPIANVALRLIEEAPEAGDCVSRLVSRTDVDWGPLTGIA